MTRIVGLTQARMGSTRLPGKMMELISGKPMIGHIFERITKVPSLDEQVLATTIDPRNDEMVAYAESLGITVYRETEEDDIAARLCGAAKMMEADAILKINGDCPMIDTGVLEQLIQLFLNKTETDYASNKITWSYPEGLSAEVISTKALCWCDKNLKTDHDRELVANWIRDHVERFKVLSLQHKSDLSHHRWCVDTAEDLDFVRSVFNALYEKHPNFGLNEILDFIQSRRSNMAEP